MDNLKIRQGETLSLLVESDDITAQTVTLTVRKGASAPILVVSQTFTTVDGKRQAQIESDDTNIADDTYDYMLTITYSDGTIKKLPDASECDGDCDLPTLTVCPALDLEVS